MEEQSIKVTAISENWGRPEQTIEFAVIRISKTRRIFSFNSAYIFLPERWWGAGATAVGGRPRPLPDLQEVT